jgi:hypothetical protein
MSSRNLWRWIATPFAVLAALIASVLLAELLSLLMARAVSQATLNSILEADWRAGVFGALSAIVTIVVGTLVAPNHRRLVSLIVLAGGAWLAWQGMHDWYFPEHHPRGYQPSSVPLVMTLVGGLAGVMFVWSFSFARSGRGDQ